MIAFSRFWATIAGQVFCYGWSRSMTALEPMPEFVPEPGALAALAKLLAACV
ncbi:hypothetical protein ART_4339 [Arthrobacter sp. PAMC 25486]|nr:hypothetical protein ART_4339 [Arthrobacter sp. PAMC 25486]